MKMKRSLSLLVILVICAVSNASIVNFDDLSLSSNSYWNGSDGSGGFVSGSAVFNNNYDSTYHSWDGWAYSNKYDTTTPGWTNQYSAITGAAQSGLNYGIAYIGWTELPSITLNNASIVEGVYVTNTTYSYLAIKNGEGPATKFDDDDWFKLSITGKNASGSTIGTIEFYLANNGQIVNTWEYIDLSGLGVVTSLEFSLDSSDHFISGGYDYGMNTPAYFAMDNLVIPEPATVILMSFSGLILSLKRRK
jgi:hypothetical protein